MPAWNERSPEVAALFNPAFCGVLLYSATSAFVGLAGRPMPFETAFLVLPLVLHAPTRAILPKQIGSPLQSWLSGEPTVRLGLADRVRTAAPITREAILYMISRQCLVLDEGALSTGAKKPKMSSKKISQAGDVRPTVQAAAMLGRLFVGAGTSTTVFTMLGITP